MWQATDRLTLVGGIRLDAYRQRIRNNVTGLTGTTTDEPVNFRIGGRYQVSDAIAVHANWGESFVLNSGTGSTGEGFAPERGQGYELGLAGTWPGIDVALTWFDIRKQGILTTDPADPSYLAPVGSLKSSGIEVDASLRFAPSWQVVGNYAWSRARADDSSFATDRVLNVPEHAGTLFVLGRFVDVEERGFSLSAGVNYVGDRPGALDASGQLLPSYVKVKAAVEYAFSPRLSVRIEADNLLDKRYAHSSYSSLWIFPGEPRTIRASVRASY
jgi:iron complex outermembrane receptor protein